MRVALLAALLAGCEVCPTGLAPLPVEIDWTVRFDVVPSSRLVGTIESRAGYGPSWVCSCTCGEDWAYAWAADRNTPQTPEALPWGMPITDSNGRDYIGRIGIGVDAGAEGETTCAITVGGGDVWEILVEAPL